MALARLLLLSATVESRPVIEQATLFVTRYVLHGEYRLSPKRKAVQIVGYLLAVVAKRHNIRLNAVCVMSNHWHAVLRDVLSKCPDFTHDFHEIVARHLNFTFGDEGQFWDQRQTSQVTPEEPADILSEIAYTAINPVHHEAVLHAKSWPGLRRVWPDPPLRFKRPEGLLDPDAKNPDGSPKWPEYAILEMHRPDGFDDESDSDLAILIRNEIAKREKTEQNRMRDTEKKPAGRRTIRRQKRHERSKTSRERGAISPRVACKNPKKKKARLAALKAWRHEYRRCLERWRNGDRDVVFPYGTYKMRRVHRANVAPRPT